MPGIGLPGFLPRMVPTIGLLQRVDHAGLQAKAVDLAGPGDELDVIQHGIDQRMHADRSDVDRP